MSKSSARLYPHPFSKDYWKDAAAEFRDTRVLIFAALMIALRVAIKSIRIPIPGVPDLNITVGFFVNALASMTYGPVVAIAAAAVSDTLGALLFPSGAYFFPFIFTEIAGSLIFALFLYRADLNLRRVVLSRFCVSFFVNIVLQTPIMALYYQMMMGKSYTWFNIPRIVKNLVLFPFEAVLLALFLRLTVPQLSRLGFVRSRVGNLDFDRKNILLMVGLTLLSGAAVWAFLTFR